MTAKKIEKLSEKIHKLYCDQYLKNNHEPYWTKGDYDRLNEETKEYDRNIARFINEHTNSKLKKIIKIMNKNKKLYARNNFIWHGGLDAAIEIVKGELSKKELK